MIIDRETCIGCGECVFTCEAGRRMACSCPCGIFNVPRTVEVLRTMAAKQGSVGGEEK
ncbi:MAG: 4Fe-4S binding protein [Syntrophales bacterium]|nr:4Fe-4S binding protein [Syntrophales bacterium]